MSDHFKLLKQTPIFAECIDCSIDDETEILSATDGYKIGESFGTPAYISHRAIHRLAV